MKNKVVILAVMLLLTFSLSGVAYASNGKAVQNRPQPDAEKVVDADDQVKVDPSETRRSAVANAVKELLNVADRNKGIGEQVREIARAQNDNHDKMEQNLKKDEKRSKFAKFILGANYGELKNAQKLLEQNREELKKLEDLKAQTKKVDQQKLMEQIQNLEKQYKEIEGTVDNSNKGFSLLGWMFRLFAK